MARRRRGGSGGKLFLGRWRNGWAGDGADTFAHQEMAVQEGQTLEQRLRQQCRRSDGQHDTDDDQRGKSQCQGNLARQPPGGLRFYG